MARDFGPFPSKPMYEVVNRRMQRAFNPQTGFAKTGQGAVTAGTGAQLVIAAYPDGALVDGLYVENSASETVTLTTNSNSNPRIDRLVMRLDMGAQTIAPFQIVGTPAASPSAPPLVQTATVYDMPLVQYRFPGSGSAQNPGSIVDERVWINRDTDWTDFTVNAPLTNGATGNEYYILNRHCTVALDAAHSVAGGGPFAAGFTIATLPKEAWPTRKLTFPVNWYGDAPAYVSVDSNGAIQVINATANHTGIIGTLNYPVG